MGETTNDLEKRLIAFTAENRRLNQENSDLRGLVRALEKEVKHWQEVARSARGLTRTYMRVNDVLIDERAQMEEQLDDFRQADFKQKVAELSCGSEGLIKERAKLEERAEDLCNQIQKMKDRLPKGS